MKERSQKILQGVINVLLASLEDIKETQLNLAEIRNPALFYTTGNILGTRSIPLPIHPLLSFHPQKGS